MIFSNRKVILSILILLLIIPSLINLNCNLGKFSNIIYKSDNGKNNNLISYFLKTPEEEAKIRGINTALLFLGGKGHFFQNVKDVLKEIKISENKLSTFLNTAAYGDFNEYLKLIETFYFDSTVYLGSIKWKFNTPGEEYCNIVIGGSPPIILDGIAYFSSECYIYAVDTKTAELKWRFPGKEKILNRDDGNLSFFNGCIYFVDTNYAYCLHLDNGNIKWIYELNKDYTFLSPPKIYKNYVYIGITAIEKQKIIVLNANNGKYITDVSLLGNPVSDRFSETSYSFHVEDDILYIYGGTYVRLINTNNFKQEKIVQCEGDLRDIEISNNYIVVSHYYLGKICTYNAKTGKKIWEFNEKPGIAKGFGDITISNNKVYFENMGKFLYAANLNTGQILWRSEFNNIYISDITIESDFIYFLTKTDNSYNEREMNDLNILNVINKETGEMIYYYLIPNTIGYPTLKDNIFYFGSQDGYFYALEKLY